MANWGMKPQVLLSPHGSSAVSHCIHQWGWLVYLSTHTLCGVTYCQWLPKQEWQPLGNTKHQKLDHQGDFQHELLFVWVTEWRQSQWCSQNFLHAMRNNCFADHIFLTRNEITKESIFFVIWISWTHIMMTEQLYWRFIFHLLVWQWALVAYSSLIKRWKSV